MDKKNKRRLLIHLLQRPEVTSALVFTRTKHGADRVTGNWAERISRPRPSHDDKSQNARQRALQNFKNGRIQSAGCHRYCRAHRRKKRFPMFLTMTCPIFRRLMSIGSAGPAGQGRGERLSPFVMGRKRLILRTLKRSLVSRCQ